jgi:hypothetical protein
MNKQNLLMNKLLKYFAIDKNMKKFVHLVGKNSEISLREWDFLCTHYAKQNIIFIDTSNSLNNLYRSQLKAYSKSNFDPFKRHNRIVIPCKYTDTRTIETTCGQLCFFKFILEYGIYDWILSDNNLQKLRNDMSKYSKTKSDKHKKEKTQVSNRQDIRITVSFI